MIAGKRLLEEINLTKEERKTGHTKNLEHLELWSDCARTFLVLVEEEISTKCARLLACAVSLGKLVDNTHGPRPK